MSQPIFASNQVRNIPSFSIAQAVSNLQSTAQSFHASTTSSLPNARASTSSTTFKAPAHKHAHHLHSIPPREKSTRTLIIDHMLWVHGRTRFAQARAELGMTDRTGGPSSSHYQHRHRPENYEEEDEIESDGEDVDVLKARSSPHDEEEETRLRRQDLSLARNLRLRAEGLEKVVTSMLVQLPPVNPINEDDLELPPTSPNTGSGSSGSRSHHPHTLPNGVRLRLALATVVNDLFARQSPPQSFRYKRHNTASSPADTRGSSSHAETPSGEEHLSSTFLPPALSLLSPLSAYSHSDLETVLPANAHSPHEFRPPKRPLQPNPRAQSLYKSGADPETANSPPSLRCPRHLHTGCEICVEAKSSLRPMSVGSSGRSNSSMGPPTTNFINGNGSTWNSWKGTPIGIAPDGGGVTGWQDGSGIGSGLLRPGTHGTVLRRNSRDEGGGGSISEEGSSARGSTKLVELIPRFLRLSALVAAELGREVREAREVEGALVDGSEESSSESEDEQDRGGGSRTEGDGGGGSGAGDGSSEATTKGGQASTTPRPHHFHNRFYQHALKPSKEWYLLLAGLLTRAALQGYLSAGWRGTDAVECLMTLGLGLGPKTATDDPDDEWEGFEPDELPSLMDAVRMLFPTDAPRTHAVEEYEAEMDERLRKFYDIPTSTPDLSTHMEDLAWQFPAEATERAAVRFCEAIAKWRGKPELETYKKKPSHTKPSGISTDDIAMSIESLVHSNPSSPSGPHLTQRANHRHKPIIELYFLQPSDAEHHLSSPLQSPLARHTQPQHPAMGTSPVSQVRLSQQSQSPSQQIPQGMMPTMIMGTTPASWSWNAVSRGPGTWARGIKRSNTEEDMGDPSKRFREM
ncbi:hypothetical protein V5O48_006477 [Marasmius crinis-equi]|uniref:Uncharacterized protein n=1 Tax=Marasmius crinis-equi TaxID=585013 RepID=A0ABR3FK07_9AGAR